MSVTVLFFSVLRVFFRESGLFDFSAALFSEDTRKLDCPPFSATPLLRSVAVCSSAVFAEPLAFCDELLFLNGFFPPASFPETAFSLCALAFSAFPSEEPEETFCAFAESFAPRELLRGSPVWGSGASVPFSEGSLDFRDAFLLAWCCTPLSLAIKAL